MFGVAVSVFVGTAWSAPEAFQAVALDRDPSKLSAFELPTRTRGTAPEDDVIIPGPWRVVSTVHGVRTWEAVLPVRPRTLFFHRPPDGMAVRRRNLLTGERNAIAHQAGLEAWDTPNTWEFSTHAIRVRRRTDLGAPSAGEYVVVYPDAARRENELNPELSGLEPPDFVLRSIQVDDTTRHGMLLPAPASVKVALTVPEGAPVLEFHPGLVPSEAGDPNRRPDVRLTVSVGGDEIWNDRLAFATFERQRVSMKKWAGDTVEITFKTEAPADDPLGYAFVADPTVFVPVDDPPRVVLVFLDTLRRDHVSLYGYERPTMPLLEAWAKDAAVLMDARSVAPWTLPSARTLLTGVQPESFFDVASLPAQFAERGWVSAAIVGNVYLSSNFDMADDWTIHRCINWPPAAIQVDRALEVLRDHPDRPVFLELHFMDAHLPYKEAWRYKKAFAGDRPEALTSDYFIRGDLTRVAKKLGDEGRQYVRDRYDNNLLAMDDQLARVLARISDDDLVVVLADHGEEFWDHGDFEHGHTLFDELLRVPLVVKGPGLVPGRYDAPTSLLDVAPTIAEWAGLDRTAMTGLALQELFGGNDEAFQARPQAFGRPLYGVRQWGVLAEGEKYIVKETREQIFDLEADPAEKKNLHDHRSSTDPWLEVMAQALQVPVERSWRLVPNFHGSLNEDLVAELDVPAGVKVAWQADAPIGAAEVELKLESNRLTVTWKKGKPGPREVYIVPVGPLADATRALTLTLRKGKDEVILTPPEDETWPPDPWASAKGALLSGKVGAQGVNLTYGVAPQVGGTAVKGFDREMQGALESLGYVEDGGGTGPAKDDEPADGTGDGGVKKAP